MTCLLARLHRQGYMKPWLGRCSQLKVHSQWVTFLLFSSHKHLLFIVSWRHTSSKCNLNLILRSPPSATCRTEKVGTQSHMNITKLTE